jgi:hypothetical protein
MHAAHSPLARRTLLAAALAALPARHPLTRTSPADHPTH